MEQTFSKSRLIDGSKNLLSPVELCPTVTIKRRSNGGPCEMQSCHLFKSWFSRESLYTKKDFSHMLALEGRLKNILAESKDVEVIGKQMVRKENGEIDIERLQYLLSNNDNVFDDPFLYLIKDFIQPFLEEVGKVDDSLDRKMILQGKEKLEEVLHKLNETLNIYADEIPEEEDLWQSVLGDSSHLLFRVILILGQHVPNAILLTLKEFDNPGISMKDVRLIFQIWSDFLKYKSSYLKKLMASFDPAYHYNLGLPKCEEEEEEEPAQKKRR